MFKLMKRIENRKLAKDLDMVIDTYKYLLDHELFVNPITKEKATEHYIECLNLKIKLLTE